MADYVKEYVRQTSGTSGGAATTVDIQDGTAGGNTTVLGARDSNPAAGDNPLLVRAILGDEEAIADLLSFSATGYVPNDVTPGAREALFTAGMLLGPRQGNNTDLRPVSVLDGWEAEPQNADNPILVSTGARTSTLDNDGTQVSIPDSTNTQVVAANADRRYLLIINKEASGGETCYLRFGGAADGDELPLSPGGHIELNLSVGIYTGAINAFHGKGSALNLSVLEF